jgi:ligand-binding sensor domain-containing protein
MTKSYLFCRLLILASIGMGVVATPAVAGTDAAVGTIKVQETFDVGANLYVRALKVEEKSGTLWVGTSAGVNEVDLASGKLRNSFSRKDGLANEYVFSIGIDQEGYKWFGTNAGGASRYRDGKWKTYFPMHGLADYWVYAFATQNDNLVWIGTWAGANSFDLKTGAFKTYVKELINEWVYGIAVDAENRVWFGTEGGVTLYDGKTWKSWSHADGLGAANVDNLPASTNTGLGTRSRHDLNTLLAGNPTYNPSYVFSILCAKDGSTWAGTWGGGVGRFDGQKWTNFSTTDGLAGNIVYSIAQDGEGVLWFGTDRGLSRYDGKTWRNFTRAEGLLDNNVYAIAVAQGGNIWVGTRRGVARIGQ